MPVTQRDLTTRFAYHPPTSDEVVEAHEQAREGCYRLAQLVSILVPEGREQALALTAIEEAMFWMNAGIARDPGNIKVAK